MNNERAKGYAATASQLTNYWTPPELGVDGRPDVRPNYCDINWFTGNGECPFLFDALYETWNNPSPAPIPWEASRILEDAPWASSSVYEQASRFMGVYALEVTELSDSTRGLSIVEGITDGGVLGRSRLSVPRFRFRVLLTALDTTGLEYGTAWLSRALDEQACSTHGASCGSTDLTFYADCPPDPASFFGSEGRSDPDEYNEGLVRSYHDVKCIEGPIVVEEIIGRSPNTYGRIVEFTLAAGTPSLYGRQGLQSGAVGTDFSTIITDVPRNSIPTPSAELAGDLIIVATNFSTNPSVESDAAEWSTGVDGTNITAEMVTSGRVTGELQAVGTSSFRAVFTATGAGTNGWFTVAQVVDISSRPADARVSINFWAAELLMAGTADRQDIEFIAAWRATAGGANLRQDVLGTVPVNGGAVSVRSLVPPAGANFVQVRAGARLASWDATTVLRLYADALTVSVP